MKFRLFGARNFLIHKDSETKALGYGIGIRMSLLLLPPANIKKNLFQGLAVILL